MNKAKLRLQLGMSTIESIIAVAVGAIGLVIAIVLLVQYAIAAYAARDLSKEAAMTPEAVNARLKPVGEITLFDPNAAPPAAAAAPVAAITVAASSAAPAGDKGEATFKSVCTACHGAGVLGAPKFGDKVAWAPRIAKGMDTLYTSALKGKNAMPAKGGNPALPDDDIKAAVQYMVSAGK
jgi:cytochrome c5